jgi:hypothetical protein
MGYDICIVRGPDWFDNPQHQITVEEWIRYRDSDPDLRRPEPDKPYYTENGFNENMALLPQEPGDPEGWPWLAWSSGTIKAKYPQEPTMLKMFKIADVFGGYLIGDDGEIYTLSEEGEIIVKQQ